jgi:hypothetical protein
MRSGDFSHFEDGAKMKEMSDKMEPEAMSDVYDELNEGFRKIVGQG